MRLQWCRSGLILWKTMASKQAWWCLYTLKYLTASVPSREVLGRVGSCAGSPALLPPVRWRAGGGFSLLHAQSHLLREEGHLMEAGRLGHYLYQERGLEKKVLICYPKTNKDQWKWNLTKQQNVSVTTTKVCKGAEVLQKQLSSSMDCIFAPSWGMALVQPW